MRVPPLMTHRHLLCRLTRYTSCACMHACFLDFSKTCSYLINVAKYIMHVNYYARELSVNFTKNSHDAHAHVRLRDFYAQSS